MFSLNVFDFAGLQTSFERVVDIWLPPRILGYLKGSGLYLAEKGCDEIAEVFASNLRRSTACLYQGKWSRFLHWCHWRNISPCKGTVLQIVKLFLYLWMGLELSVPAVKGYQATLNHVFSLAGMDLAANKIICRMFNCCEKTCAP